MAQISCGLLMYRKLPEIQFFLVHPGGPYYKNKMEGVWTIPKGLRESDEALLVTAQREFREETGIDSSEPYQALGTTMTKGAKTIYAWAFSGEWEEATGITSNTFEMEWPPRSGRKMLVPEVDRAKWCNYEEASQLIHPSQYIFLEKACSFLGIQ